MQTRACLIVELNAPVNFLTKKNFWQKLSFGQQFFFSSFTRCRQNNDFREIKLIFLGGINMRSSQSVSSFLRSFVFWLLCATQVLIRWASHHFVSWKKKEKHTDSPALCWSQQTHRQRRNTQTVLLYVEVDRLTDREETSQHCTNQIASYCCALQSQS